MSQSAFRADHPLRGMTGPIVTILFMLSLIGIAVFMVFNWVSHERASEVSHWQKRLEIVADSRMDAVQTWYMGQRQELQNLANNAALQLYMTQMSTDAEGADSQIDYLRNLLSVVADQAGFSGKDNLSAQVAANIASHRGAGLALLPGEGKAAVVTKGFPPLKGELASFIKELDAGQVAVMPIFLLDDVPTMAWAVPIFHIQGNYNASDQVGWIVGVKSIEKELYPLLFQPGEAFQSLETLLVRRDNNVVTYLNPLSNALPLSRHTAINADDVAAKAVREPGLFFEAKDYNAEDVLAVSRVFEEANWVIVTKVSSVEALGAAFRRLQQLLIILMLVVVIAGVAMFAIWRHGSSRRLEIILGNFKKLSLSFKKQAEFLRVVTDAQPNAIAVVDQENKYRFVNKVLSQRAGIEGEDMLGKDMASVFGPDAVKFMLDLNGKALQSKATVGDIHRVDLKEGHRVIQSVHVPVNAEPAIKQGVLIVEEDITDAIMEKELREKALDQLIKTIIALVDRRDPDAANHSERVGSTARVIAEEMGLEKPFPEASEVSGRLFNIGKLFVPQNVLTKASKLTDDEIKLVRQALRQGTDLLRGVPFEGPVIETLENADSDWEELEGTSAPITASIIAVSNTFVAMASPRAHRQALAPREAIDILMKDGGRRYSRAVVTALANVLENHIDRLSWMHIKS